MSELKHFGILGMKWGHRKSSSDSSSGSSGGGFRFRPGKRKGESNEAYDKDMAAITDNLKKHIGADVKRNLAPAAKFLNSTKRNVSKAVKIVDNMKMKERKFEDELFSAGNPKASKGMKIINSMIVSGALAVVTYQLMKKYMP